MGDVGSTSALRRAAITLCEAGVFPLVVVVPFEDDEARYHLAGRPVVFLHHDGDEPRELIDSVRLGLSYLADKCDRVVFTPVNCSTFAPSTVGRLAAEEGDVVLPSYRGRSGHPVVVSCDAVDRVLSYRAPGGLAAALASFGDRRRWVEVDDPGVVGSVHDACGDAGSLDAAIVRPVARLSLEREAPFFDDRTKLLLFLVADTGNMRRACDMMGLSYGKGWDLVNRLEAVLGAKVVERSRGGRRGGTTRLTETGERVLCSYQRFEERVSSGVRRVYADFLAEVGVSRDL
ncbi:NTP transferase domain-containing protein [Atopobiaceae bacterium 24-176]